MGKPYTTLSYPRSGSHFVRAAMKEYHTVVPPGDRKHGKTPYNIRQEELEWYKKQNTIYVLRDLRDTLVSSYDYMFSTRIIFKSHNIDGLSFSDFLHGKADFEYEHIHKDYTEFVYSLWTKPIEYWVQHTEWLKHDWLHSIVRYEEALNKWTIEKLLMPGEKSKGVVGRWREWFSNEDLEYLWSIAGDRMIELGYDK